MGSKLNDHHRFIVWRYDAWARKDNIGVRNQREQIIQENHWKTHIFVGKVFCSSKIAGKFSVLQKLWEKVIFQKFPVSSRRHTTRQKVNRWYPTSRIVNSMKDDHMDDKEKFRVENEWEWEVLGFFWEFALTTST